MKKALLITLAVIIAIIIIFYLKCILGRIYEKKESFSF